MKYFFLAVSLVTTVALLGDRSGYAFPPRGRVTLEQARLMTPLSLTQRALSNSSFDILQKEIQRFGLFDDAGLAILVAIQISLAASGIYLIRRGSVAP